MTYPFCSRLQEVGKVRDPECIEVSIVIAHGFLPLSRAFASWVSISRKTVDAPAQAMRMSR